MTKFTKEKRDRDEYRYVIENNSKRTDFICPCCKRSFSISLANEGEIVDVEDLVYRRFGERPEWRKIPCYAYRFDDSCYKKLKRNKNIIKWFERIYFTVIILVGLVIMSVLKSDVVGWLIWTVYFLCFILYPFILLNQDEKWQLFARISLPSFKSIDFDEALNGNAVVSYVGMMSSSEKREIEERANKLIR